MSSTLSRVDRAASSPELRHARRHMLQSLGWIAAHRFLFADLRVHLLGWPTFLAPDGRVTAFQKAAPPA